MSTTKRIAFAATPMLMLALVLGSTVALAHMKVSKTAPEEGATLTEAPTSVQVWYTQEPDAAVSKMSLQGPSGDVKLFIHPGGDKSLMGMIEGSIGDGDYVVTWQTAGDDGHIQKGEYKFTVKSAE